MTSYENQTKKAINNKFIQDAMTEFLRQELEIYFIDVIQLYCFASKTI